MAHVVITLNFLIASLAASDHYEFVPLPERRVGIERKGDTIVIGKFDANGEFTQSAVEKTGMRYGPIDWVLITASDLKPVPVYELRSGTLIPGTQQCWGPFVPTVGGTVIKFSDYRYSPSAPRIWNLPGYFRLKPAAAVAKP